jgi:hypothetical protein
MLKKKIIILSLAICLLTTAQPLFCGGGGESKDEKSVVSKVLSGAKTSTTVVVGLVGMGVIVVLRKLGMFDHVYDNLLGNLSREEQCEEND